MIETLDVADVVIDGYRQAITLRSYRPIGLSGLPIVLFFHGGGFVSGGLEDGIRPATRLALTVPAWVVCVGYSLAPRFPFPAATEDAFNALIWARANALRHGAEAGLTAAVGYDSGGNIAAALAALVRDRDVPDLRAQALLAPLLDPSLTRLAKSPGLGDGDLALHECAKSYRAYLPFANQRLHPYAAPLESRRLRQLPPTLIACAEKDLVRRDGESFGRELISAGVPVEITRYDGVTHGEIISLHSVLDHAADFMQRRLFVMDDCA